MKLISLVLVLLTAFEASANNAFIPNYYRNRREANDYSAIAYSQRKEAGLLVGAGTLKQETDGTKTLDSDILAVRPHSYYRVENVNMEVEYSTVRSDNKNVLTGDTIDINAAGPLINVGFELPTTPIAVAISYDSDKTKFQNKTSGLKIDTDTRTLQMGVGYKMEGNTFLGFGISQEQQDSLLGDSDEEQIVFGAGKVYGDYSNPDAAAEAILTFENERGDKTYNLEVRGLRNLGAFQYYGALGLGYQNGVNIDGRDYLFKAGVDYQINDTLYVGPELNVIVVNYDNEESTNLTPSLQGGYRDRHLEFFLRYDYGKTKSEDMTGASPTTDILYQNLITIAGIYKF